MTPSLALLHTDPSGAWHPEPGVLLLVVTSAALYGRGVHALWRDAGRGRGVRPWQVWSFAAGMLTLVIALASPLDALADALFSAHMIQHVLLATVAPPLLVAGAPMVATLWGLPPRTRRAIALGVGRRRWLVGTWRVVTAPSRAWLLHAVALWSWHLPQAYDLALRNDAVHALEHASFLGTAVLLWWSILHPRVPRQAGYGIGILTLFATALQSGALGALLTFTPRVWFPIQSLGAAAHGLTPLEDQQTAGLVMWVVGGVLYVVAICAIFVVWMQTAQRESVAPLTRASRAAGR